MRTIVLIVAALMLLLLTAAQAQDAVTSTRLSGSDRFETSVAISQYQHPQGADVIYIANGISMVDAMTANNSNGPTLLVTRDSVSQSVLDEVKRLNPNHLIFLGGTSAISENVKRQIEGAARGEDTTAKQSAFDPDKYMLSLINQERTSPLEIAPDIDQVSDDWSDNMAETRMLAHNPSYSMQYCCWKQAAENVGYTPHSNMRTSIERMHNALMNSPEHRENIVNPGYDDMGIGLTVGGCPAGMASEECLWTTQNFRDRM